MYVLLDLGMIVRAVRQENLLLRGILQAGTICLTLNIPFF